MPGTSRFATAILCYVLSGFVGLRALRSFEGRDGVDAENLAYFQLTVVYLLWRHLWMSLAFNCKIIAK